MRTPINVKLGRSNARHGFYKINVEKEYTEIQKNKMTYNVLNAMSNFAMNELGMHELTLAERVLEIQPELSHDEYGYLTTLPSLMKDLVAGGLVDYAKNGSRITKLGRKFLENNVITDDLEA